MGINKMQDGDITGSDAYCYWPIYMLCDVTDGCGGQTALLYGIMFRWNCAVGVLNRKCVGKTESSD